MEKQTISRDSWIRRESEEIILNDIHEASSNMENVVHIYIISGLAGTGKTVLGRSLGKVLGSSNGYEPSQEGPEVWSGLLDVFDPDTSNNQGLEQRIKQAFNIRKVNFQKYDLEREFYDTYFKTGIRGTGLEAQRHAIEAGFAADLAAASRLFYPVIALDTIERLSSTADPAQKELDLGTDTSSLVGWLGFQIQELPRGMFLFFGRKTQFFSSNLQDRLKIGPDGRSPDGRFILKTIELISFAPEDLEAFFAQRQQQFAELNELLDAEIRLRLFERTRGNPLLLDLALQTLLQCKEPATVLAALRSGIELEDLFVQLLDAYHNTLANLDRKALLHYLVVARNGLFKELLMALEPVKYEQLWQELLNMEKLPYIKAREVYVGVPEQRERQARLTFFLHDELYLLYERSKESKESIINDSQRIVNWYDEQINNVRRNDETLYKDSEPTRDIIIQSSQVYDLMVESLLYRLRIHPREGYAWFLMEEDRAIRSSISIGLDMRLRDGMAQFMLNAGQENVDPGLNLISPIDKDNVRLNAPEILTDYTIDSAMLWIKRLSSRGDQAMAIKTGQIFLARVIAYYQGKKKHQLPYTEFHLWFGQALMYQGATKEARDQYLEIVKLLRLENPEQGLEQMETSDNYDKFVAVRHCLVIGRAFNNLGFLSWMNLGCYRQAITYFQQAIYWYRLASNYGIFSLQEELANTNDNMGRVYAILGYPERSKALIQKAYEMRKGLGFSYRQALSANSLAIAWDSIGQSQQAMIFIDAAMLEFRNADASRGIGLGLITLGTIQRHQAEMWREQNESVAQALRYTEDAETNLRDAVRIFQEIQEPIRLVQAYNELGSCYRARHFILLHRKDTTARYIDSTLKLGVATYKRAIEYAQKGEFHIDELDSLQDLAVLYYRAGDFREAKYYLNQVRAGIAPEYQIREKIGLGEIAIEQRIDANYKILAQAEMLEGAMIYEQGVLETREKNNYVTTAVPSNDETYKLTFAHYLFADIYFKKFSGEPYALQRTHDRMYKRFEHCHIKLIREITKEYTPQLLINYNIDKDAARGLFADLFGVFE